MPNLSNMKKTKRAKAMFVLAFAASLLSCSQSALKGVSLDKAKELLSSAQEAQSQFEVLSTKYSFCSSIKEEAVDGWTSHLVKTSSLKVSYEAPFLISDEKTIFSLTYELTIDSIFNKEENTHKVITVSKDNGVYSVTEGTTKHEYNPAVDSYLTGFMNLPYLINSNNIAALAIASQFINSIGEQNSLTSFEALSSGEEDFVLTFTGASLSISNLYDEDPNMPNDVAVESFSVASSKNRVDSYSSKYSYPNNVVTIEGRKIPVTGEIEVGFTYEA